MLSNLNFPQKLEILYVYSNTNLGDKTKSASVDKPQSCCRA